MWQLREPVAGLADSERQTPLNGRRPDSIAPKRARPRVLEALKLASAALSAANVRYVVVGGLAVGANGYPRATKYVDFLVGAKLFTTMPTAS